MLLSDVSIFTIFNAPFFNANQIFMDNLTKTSMVDLIFATEALKSLSTRLFYTSVF